MASNRSRELDGHNFSPRAINTERLLLRRFSQVDFQDVSDWEKSADAPQEIVARQFLDFCFHEYKQRGQGPWAIVVKQTGKVVGNCGYIGIRDFCGEVNYYIAPGYRGQGLATEAVSALLKYGFGDLDLVRIQARCRPDNPASARVLQKLGMKLNETVPPNAIADRPQEERLYAILRGDFEPA